MTAWLIITCPTISPREVGHQGHRRLVLGRLANPVDEIGLGLRPETGRDGLAEHAVIRRRLRTDHHWCGWRRHRPIMTDPPRRTRPSSTAADAVAYPEPLPRAGRLPEPHQVALAVGEVGGEAHVADRHRARPTAGATVLGDRGQRGGACQSTSMVMHRALDRVLPGAASCRRRCRPDSLGMPLSLGRPGLHEVVLELRHRLDLPAEHVASRTRAPGRRRRREPRSAPHVRS